MLFLIKVKSVGFANPTRKIYRVGIVIANNINPHPGLASATRGGHKGRIGGSGALPLMTRTI